MTPDDDTNEGLTADAACATLRRMEDRAMDFYPVTEAARAAERWMRSEVDVLDLGPLYFDLEVIPTADGADVVCMPFERPGPRTRCASIY
jgi:hypothetical protein